MSILFTNLFGYSYYLIPSILLSVLIIIDPVSYKLRLGIFKFGFFTRWSLYCLIVLFGDSLHIESELIEFVFSFSMKTSDWFKLSLFLFSVLGTVIDSVNKFWQGSDSVNKV